MFYFVLPGPSLREVRTLTQDSSGSRSYGAMLLIGLLSVLSLTPGLPAQRWHHIQWAGPSGINDLSRNRPH